MRNFGKICVIITAIWSEQQDYSDMHIVCELAANDLSKKLYANTTSI